MPESFNTYVSKLIARKLTELNMTNAELADRIGVARSSVGDWISGKSIPKTDKVTSICDVLNISLYEFFNIKDPSNLSAKDIERLTKIHNNKSLEIVIDNFQDNK